MDIAVKTCTDPEGIGALVEEAEILRVLSSPGHENVVQLIGVTCTVRAKIKGEDNNNKIIIINNNNN